MFPSGKTSIVYNLLVHRVRAVTSQRSCILGNHSCWRITNGRRAIASKEELKAQAYLNTLEPIVLRRYREKIAVIGGIDPYSIPEKDLGTDLDLLPKVNYGDLWQYLVLTASSLYS